MLNNFVQVRKASLASYPIGSVERVADLTTDRWGNPTALTAACDFLDHYLGDGPKPSLDVYAAADQEGISRATLRRAAQKQRIRRTRPVATGPRFMYLPIARVPSALHAYPIRASATAGTRATNDAYDKNGYGDGDDEDRYDSGRAAGSGWGWIVTVAVLACGVGGAVLARRRFAPWSIAGTTRSPSTA